MLNSYGDIWQGSVRAFICLCFLMLTIVLAAGYHQYIRHSLSHSVSDKFQKQKAIHLSIKEVNSFRLCLISRSDQQENDDLKV
jgi:hypothetical protein